MDRNHLVKVFGYTLELNRWWKCCGSPVELSIVVGGEHLPDNTRVRTQLVLEGNPSRITEASFSHDCIELVASGTLYLP